MDEFLKNLRWKYVSLNDGKVILYDDPRYWYIEKVQQKTCSSYIDFIDDIVFELFDTVYVIEREYTNVIYISEYALHLDNIEVRCHVWDDYYDDDWDYYNCIETYVMEDGVYKKLDKEMRDKVIAKIKEKIQKEDIDKALKRAEKEIQKVNKLKEITIKNGYGGHICCDEYEYGFRLSLYNKNKTEDDMVDYIDLILSIDSYGQEEFEYVAHYNDNSVWDEPLNRDIIDIIDDDLWEVGIDLDEIIKNSENVKIVM